MKKTLGLALLALVMSFALQGCQSYHRGYAYRDGYAPGYVQVRVGSPYRRGVVVRGPYGPVYRDHYYYDSHGGRHFRKFNDKHHDRYRDDHR